VIVYFGISWFRLQAAIAPAEIGDEWTDRLNAAVEWLRLNV
jgi:hypothetical protein